LKIAAAYMALRKAGVSCYNRIWINNPNHLFYGQIRMFQHISEHHFHLKRARFHLLVLYFYQIYHYAWYLSMQRKQLLEESAEYTMKYHFTTFTRKQLPKFLISMLDVLQIHILAICLSKIALSTCVL
jgi:hypothetical protein